MSQSEPNRGMRIFLLVWLGQFVSLFGSGLTGFTLGVWVYQQTGSATKFSLIILCTMLPGILLAPILGVIADRWDRRLVMILADTGAALGTLSIGLLLLTNLLEIWHIYIGMAITSTFSALQWPAYAAAVTLLVPKRHFGRASGLIQFGQAAGQIISPLLAGVIVTIIGVSGVILIDFGTYLFAVALLLIVRFPGHKRSEPVREKGRSLLKEAAYGWSYITARPGLLGLLIFFAATNFFTAMIQALNVPLILSFTSVGVLGAILSVASSGLLAGSLVMSIWGGPKRRVQSILGFGLVQSAALIVVGLQPNPVLVGGALFVLLFFDPIVNGCSQAIWQSKTLPEVQGRVFAARRMIGWSTVPLAYLAAGPLADKVFNPLLNEGGRLESSVGQIIGTGPGRGTGLLYIAIGLITILATFVSYLYPRLIHLEQELPDMIADDAPASA